MKENNNYHYPNMKKFLIRLAMAIMAIVIVIMNCQNRKLRASMNSPVVVTDTIWVDKPFKPKIEYPNFQVPNTVFIYRVDSIPVERIEYRDRIITVVQKDSTRLEYNELFLTNHPKCSKLIQLLNDKNQLSLTTLNIQGEIHTEEYKVDYHRYRYNYVNGNLTYKKLPFYKRFKPVAQYTVRPLHNLHDLDLGLKYNTSKINYEAGLNINYYPGIKPNPGFDPYLRVSYNF